MLKNETFNMQLTFIHVLRNEKGINEGYKMILVTLKLNVKKQMFNMQLPFIDRGENVHKFN